jgi:DNA-directed RNA polymerase specialized sigma24 family protein
VTDQQRPDEATIARVLGAARAAADGEAAAEHAVVRAFAAAGRGPHDPERIAATAVRLALRDAPAAAFAAMAPPDAEAVALVRLVGLSAADTAAVLGVAAGEVGRRLTRGLVAVRGGGACARAQAPHARGAPARACPALACA